MQAIHILGNQSKLRKYFLHLCQGIMPWIGLYFFYLLSSPGIPLPDHFRVFFESFWGGQLLWLEIGPQPVRIPESGNAGFSRYSRPGYDYYGLSSLESG